MLAALKPWIALYESDFPAFSAFVSAAAGWGCGIAIAQVAQEQVCASVSASMCPCVSVCQCKVDGAFTAAWTSLCSRLPPAPA